jgi:hypothetical protein
MISGFLWGYDFAVTGPAQMFFVLTWPDISNTTKVSIVNTALISAAIGSLLAGYV